MPKGSRTKACGSLPGRRKKPITVACVGDSITYGSKVHHRDTRSYPSILEQLLGKGWRVLNFGVSGVTLSRKGNKPYWITDAFKSASEANAAVYVIALGTNDTKPINWTSREDFEKDLSDLVQHFSKLPSRPRMFACLPPPVFEADEAGINENVLTEEVIPLISQLAKRASIAVIDLHSPLRKSPDLFPDGIHPNAEGARRIANLVFQNISRGGILTHAH